MRISKAIKRLVHSNDEDPYILESNILALVLCIVIFVVFLLFPHPVIDRWVSIVVMFVLILLMFAIQVGVIMYDNTVYSFSIVWNTLFGFLLQQTIAKTGYMRITNKRPIWHWVIVIVLLCVLLLSDLRYLLEDGLWLTHLAHFIACVGGVIIGIVFSLIIGTQMNVG